MANGPFWQFIRKLLQLVVFVQTGSAKGGKVSKPAGGKSLTPSDFFLIQIRFSHVYQNEADHDHDESGNKAE